MTQEIRTAPAYQSKATRNTDALANQFAHDHRLTNLGSAREGENVMNPLMRARRGQMPSSEWGGSVPYNEPGWSARGEAPATIAPQMLGVQPTGVLNTLKPALSAPKPVLVGKPDTARVT